MVEEQKGNNGTKGGEHVGPPNNRAHCLAVHLLKVLRLDTEFLFEYKAGAGVDKIKCGYTG